MSYGKVTAGFKMNQFTPYKAIFYISEYFYVRVNVSLHIYRDLCQKPSPTTHFFY